jgi:hypothetical protein
MLGSLLAVVAMVGLVAVGTRTAKADQRDFTFINNSSYIITHLYVAPSSSNDWGEDILGTSVLGPGESVFVYFMRFDGNTCYYDIRVTDESGEDHEEYQFDLCSLDTITFG